MSRFLSCFFFYVDRAVVALFLVSFFVPIVSASASFSVSAVNYFRVVSLELFSGCSSFQVLCYVESLT